MPQLRIEPLGLTVPVQPAQTLLQAALSAGVTLPSSCRNGTCRACMARVLAGTVRYRVEWPGVLAEERAEGWTLPCVALPAEAAADITLWVPQATLRAPAQPASS